MESGDEAIAGTIRREPHEGAATTDLEVRVSVNQGVMRLRGSVSSLLDAGERRRGRLPHRGRDDVIDELKIEDLA